MLSGIEKGYLAGFIDGEGSLIISKREHIGHLGKRYTGYSAYLDIGNTHKEVMYYINELVGNTSKVYENQSAGNRKLAYRVRIGYKLANPLIQQVQSLLVVKREQARVFLSYKEATDKEPLWQEMSRLNRRGIL